MKLIQKLLDAARCLLTGAEDGQVVHGLEAEGLRHALAGHGLDAEIEALRLAVGDDEVADLAADDAGHLAEGHLVRELLQVEVDKVDVERDRAPRGERVGDARSRRTILPPKTLASPRPEMAICLGADVEAREFGLDLARQLELGRLDGEARDVDVAEGEGAEPLEGAGGGIEAEDRPAELEPAAEELEARAARWPGRSCRRATRCPRASAVRKAILEFADTEEALRRGAGHRSRTARRPGPIRNGPAGRP